MRLDFVDPGDEASHDHFDGDGSDEKGGDASGDFDVALNERFAAGADVVMQLLEQEDHADGEGYRQHNGCACGDRVQLLAGEDTGADGSRADEAGHGHGSGDVVGIAAKGFDGFRAFKDKLQTNEEKNDASENLEGGEFGLNHGGEDRVAKK